MATFDDCFRIQSAVRAAQARTGDTTLGTQIEAGMFRAVQCIYQTTKAGKRKGAATIIPLTCMMPVGELIEWIEEYTGQ